jgi:hypothetical protein
MLWGVQATQDKSHQSAEPATPADLIAAVGRIRERTAAGGNGGDVMLELLDRQQRLTGNQRRIVFADSRRVAGV